MNNKPYTHITIQKEDFLALRFEEDSEYAGMFHRRDFPFYVTVNNGYFRLNVNLEYTVSSGEIPATKQNLDLLLKAFHIY